MVAGEARFAKKGEKEALKKLAKQKSMENKRKRLADVDEEENQDAAMAELERKQQRKRETLQEGGGGGGGGGGVLPPGLHKMAHKEKIMPKLSSATKQAQQQQLRKRVEDVQEWRAKQLAPKGGTGVDGKRTPRVDRAHADGNSDDNGDGDNGDNGDDGDNGGALVTTKTVNTKDTLPSTAHHFKKPRTTNVQRKRKILEKATAIKEAGRTETTEMSNGQPAASKYQLSLLLAAGAKVLDDPKLIKKSLKRMQNKKKKSALAWKERLAAQEGEQKARQKKRRDNLSARKKQIKERKVAKRKKKLLRPRF